MSTTDIGVNDALAQKLWSKSLAMSERANLEFNSLIGTDRNSIIQIKGETGKSNGDKVTFGLQARLTGAGITENETATGNGEALTLYSDAVLINELGHNVGVKSKYTIDSQRVPFDLREQAKLGLAEWWADRLSATFFNQVCGYTPQSNLKYTGLNAVVDAAATRRVTAGTGTTDESIGTGDVFTLNLLDQAKEKASVGSAAIRPLRIGGAKKYVVYLHPYQVTSMRDNAAGGQWLDIQKAAMAGMNSKLSPIYTGALGEYNGMILREAQDVTQGVNSSTGAAITTVRRAVLLGCQAAVIGFAKGVSGPGRYRWNEELIDHKRQLEVSAWSIFGMKKTMFNSVDHGALIIPTYAVASS